MSNLNFKEQLLTNLDSARDKEALYILGIQLLFGDGVEQNTKKGLKSLKQAAAQKHIEARFLLGQLFQTGFKTLQPDLIQAIRWYKLAAAQKHLEAKQILQKLEAPLRAEIANESFANKERQVFPKPGSQNQSFTQKKAVNSQKVGQEKKALNPPRPFSQNKNLNHKKGCIDQKTGNNKNILNQQDLLNDALLKACQKGEIEKVKKAIGQGADVNTMDQEGFTPLHYAARFGRALIVRFLLDNKASPHGQNGEGKSAAHLALKNRHTEIVHLIKRYES